MDSINSYRQKFRKEIVPSYYNAKLHISFLIIMVLSLSWFALRRIEHFHVLGIAAFTLSIMYCNLHIYLVHRFMLHKKMKGLAWAYDMHIIHHQLYVGDKLEFEELSDLYMLLMPPQILLMYYFLYCPMVLAVIYYFVPLYLFWYCALAFFLWFGYYEFIHFIEHMPKEHFIMKFPYFRFLRRFHEVHHDHALMNKKHFDIAIPMYDYLLKTNKREKMK